jgi:hypothetical protein
MKKCAYCGRDNPEEVVNCQECGTEFLQPRETPPPKKPHVRKPVLGVLSLAMPFIGVLLVGVLAKLHLDRAILQAFEGSLVCGTLFAVAAFTRGERYRVLRWLGLLLNLAIIFFVMALAQSIGRNC